jgi:hypothetical protein
MTIDLPIATDNTTVVAYLQNQGGTHSSSLYLLCREIVLLCDSLQTVLTVRHVPGNPNLIADALSRFCVPVNTVWELHPVIFHPFPGDGHCMHCPSFLVWDWRDKCLQFVIQTGGKQIYRGRSHIRVIAWKITGCNSHTVFTGKTILIAPAWPRQSWFMDLLLLSCAKPLRFPLKGDLLYQFKGKSFIKAWRNSICTHGCCQERYRKNSASCWAVILRGSMCFDRHQEQKIDHFESYNAPVDCLTAP